VQPTPLTRSLICLLDLTAIIFAPPQGFKSFEIVLRSLMQHSLFPRAPLNGMQMAVSHLASHARTRALVIKDAFIYQTGHKNGFGWGRGASRFSRRRAAGMLAG